MDNNTLTGEVTSSKKISLNISNVDSNFDFYQIAVLEYTSNTQTVTQVKQSNPIPATQSKFTYTGNESFDEIDITSILVDSVTVDKVVTHAQLDNRLYLGNVTEYSPDYSSYQKFASAITAE